MGTAFVGRERQLADLTAALEEAVAGAGRLLLVTGEAGIGKTRLCEELAVAARRRGVDVVSAACWESGAVPAYWPWEQVVRQLGGRGLGPAAGGTLAADPDLARVEQFEEVAALLARAARQRPRLVVLDDLHWADVPSVRLLSHLAPALRRLPVLAVATYRPDEVPPATPLGAALASLARQGDRVVLAGLAPADLAILVEATAGEAAPPAAAEALHRHTAGNPLFVRELVQLVGAGGLSDGDLPVPDTVRGVLHGRLARLSPASRGALELGAVAGDEFVLADVSEVAGEDLLDPVGEAEAASVLRPTGVGRWAFTHPLLRAVLYDELGVARRVRLHRRVGEVLEARHAAGARVDLAVLSHHFVRAAPAGTAAKAVTYAAQAADRAMAVLAYEDAGALLRQALAALDLAPDAIDRVEVLLDLGAALTASGDQPGARDAYLDAAARAREAGRPDQLARAALGVGSGGGFEVTPADREQVDLLEEALRGLDAGVPGLWGEVAARLSVALWQTGQEERRTDLAEQALAAARAGGAEVSPRQLAAVLAAHCDAIPGPVHAEQRVVEAGEVVDIGVALGDRGVELLGRRLRLVARLEMGDVAGADAEIDAYAAVAGLLRQPLYAWYVPMWRAMRALMRGDLAACERSIEEAAAVGTLAHSANAAVLLPGLRWFLHREAHRFQEPLAVLEELLAYQATFGLQMQVSSSLVLVEAGRTTEARANLRVAGPLLGTVPLDSEWLPMMGQAAEAACLLGDLEVCRWTYDALLPHRHRFGVEGIAAVCWGSVERQLGLLAAALGRPDLAADHFDRALAANHGLGAPLLVARTERDAGVALGDRDRLAAALAAYRELGIEGRVVELEALLGGPSPARENLLRRDGQVWTVVFAGVTAHVKDVKGMADLAVLLARPGTEVSAGDLAGGTVEGDAGEILDAQARDAYKARLVELEAELDAADAAGDSARSDAAQAERDALLAQLSSAFGLGGRPRRAGAATERARGAVTWRVRDAIARIEAVHPDLGHHLRRSVRTGTWCAYDPDPPVAWSLTP